MEAAAVRLPIASEAKGRASGASAEHPDATEAGPGSMGRWRRPNQLHGPACIARSPRRPAGAPHPPEGAARRVAHLWCFLRGPEETSNAIFAPLAYVPAPGLVRITRPL